MTPKGSSLQSEVQSDVEGARIIDGKATAASVRAEVARAAAQLIENGFQPGLSVVLVGDDAPSQVYVRNKEKAAAAAGFRSETVRLAGDTSQAELEATVERLNADPNVHGILVQLPLPAALDAIPVIARLAPHKDVDGLTAHNVAALFMGQEIGRL